MRNFKELREKMSPESKERADALIKETLSNISRQNSIKDLLVGILKQEAMTAKQIVGCLMSEPYNIEWKDLDKVVDILNDLSRADLLRVRFRKTNDILGVEPLFRAISAPTVLDGLDS